MKLISWNVNGLRACMGKGFLDFSPRKLPAVQSGQLICGRYLFQTVHFGQFIVNVDTFPDDAGDLICVLSRPKRTG